MNITPLFRKHNKNDNYSELDMIQFLDIPDEDEEKRAFLNRYSIDEDIQKKWDLISASVEAAQQLKSMGPDPSVRSRIMEEAYRRTSSPSNQDYVSRFSVIIPGWRWAWVALFFATSIGLYGHFTQKTEKPLPVQQVHSEITSLDNDLDRMFMDLRQTFENFPDEST